MLEEAKELGRRFCDAVERELDERGEFFDEEEEEVKSMAELFYDVCGYEPFLIRGEDNLCKCELLLDLYSYLKEELPWVLPELESVFQSVHGVWSIFLSDRKTSLLLEVLKLQEEKIAVEMLDVPVKESEVRIFVQCLPYISELRFSKLRPGMLEQPKFLQKLICEAAAREEETGEKILELLSSVCNYETFLRMDKGDNYLKSELLLDLYSYLKDYETQTGRAVLPALQPLFQSVPAFWSIHLSDRKTSILLDVLKLQQEKIQVELLGVTDEESEVRIFVQCLPYISQLRFSKQRPGMLEQPKFLQKLICEAAAREEETGEKILELLSSVCNYKTFLCMDKDTNYLKSELLLDLYSYLKDYETQTGRAVLPAVQPLYQSVPAFWSIYLSDRKTSILLDVLKLQQEKKQVELLDVTDEESEVRMFVQCLPYISQLRFSKQRPGMLKQPEFLQKLICEAAEREEETGEKILELLSSVCNYKTFLLMGKDHNYLKSELLLDLYSYLKDYETQTGRAVLPALQPLYQSVPAFWSIHLLDRKTSILLDVLKLQQEKKLVQLLGVTDEESEVRIFVQCLPYISQLRFSKQRPGMLKQPEFLQKLICEAAAREEETGEKILELLSSVCNYKTFLRMDKDTNYLKSELLLDLYSYLKDYETQTGRAVLPALQPLYQSVPAVWSIYLSDRKTSILLEVLKLQQEKKRVELLDVTDEESEVRIFVQCLPYISQLSFSNQRPGMLKQPKFLQKLICEAAAREEETGEKILELFSSVFNYKTFLLMDKDDNDHRCDLLLDLYCDMKNYEMLTGRSVLPALQPLYLLPAVWSTHLSDRKTATLIEVLHQQKEKKALELLDFTYECESDVTYFLHCLPYISKLSFTDRRPGMLEQPKFLATLICEAAKRDEETGEKLLQLFSSVFNYETFLLMGSDYDDDRSKLLLFLYKDMKDYETQTGRSVLPALQPLYQAVPAVWSIYLSDGMTPLLLEVLQLQQEKKPVELLDFSNEESDVRTFFQCLPYISQLRSSKSVLLRLLTLVSGAPEMDKVMRAGSLGRALGGELDLSKTRLHLKACKRLALVLKHTEGLSELDLSHCQLSDQQLGILIPHLHKAQVLDLSHNKLTDAVTDRLLQLLSTNTCIKVTRLSDNCFMDTGPFMKDKRFEINKNVGTGPFMKDKRFEINKDVGKGKKRRKEQKNKRNKKTKR